MARWITGVLLGVFGAGAAVCQTRPAFDIADVHMSPRADWVKNRRMMDGGVLAGDRYELRRATLVDLIRTAYNVDANKVFGGPGWVDYDRFEVIAKTQPGTRPERLRLMLQTLLAERFHLVVKEDTQQVPGYVLSKGKGSLGFGPPKDAVGGSVSTGCQNTPHFEPPSGSYANFQCRNVTMEAFAAVLHGPLAMPVQDATGLDGMWDLDLQYPMGNMAAGGKPADAVIEGVAKLGLKLEPGRVPQAVLTVVSADEQPSANPAGVTEALPTLPAPEFEVASVRLGDGTGPSVNVRFEPGGRVTARGMPPGGLIRDAWGLPLGDEIVGLPKSFQSGISANITILAKAPEGVASDRDHMYAMLKALLIERYKMVWHMEDRPMDAQTLVAVKPKLTKADPAGRTGCARQGQQQQGQSLMVKLVCTNMTMTQFAEQIRGIESSVKYPVLDGTGLEGAWDFTIDYDAMASLAGMRMRLGIGGAAAAEGQASDPSGSQGFADVLQRQLGLKLETHKRPEPVLVIDHMEEKPTEN